MLHVSATSSLYILFIDFCSNLHGSIKKNDASTFLKEKKDT